MALMISILYSTREVLWFLELFMKSVIHSKSLIYILLYNNPSIRSQCMACLRILRPNPACYQAPFYAIHCLGVYLSRMQTLE